MTMMMMGEAIAINMNCRVQVRLTEAGCRRYEQYYDMVHDGNVYQSELWNLIEVFGPGTNWSSPIPFVDNEIVVLVGPLVRPTAADPL